MTVGKANTKFAGRIRGYASAAESLGITWHAVRQAADWSHKLNMAPKRIGPAKRSAHYWDNAAKLKKWYDAVLSKHAAAKAKKLAAKSAKPAKPATKKKAVKKTKPKTRSVPGRPAETEVIVTAILGTKAASKVLNVTPEVIRAATRAVSVPTTRNSDGVFFLWESEEALIAWWAKVQATGFQFPGRSQPAPTEQEVLTKLLGKEHVKSLKSLRAKIDTPSVRLYRKMRQQPEMTLTNVLELVLARGLAELEEEL